MHIRQGLQHIVEAVSICSFVLLLFGCGVVGSQSSSKQSNDNSAHRQAQDNSNLIVAGQSVGPVQLGDTRERALEAFGAIFGNKYSSEEEDGDCRSCSNPLCREPLNRLAWLDFERAQSGIVQNGIVVYVSNGQVAQIEAATTLYRTIGGITHDSKPEEVRRQYSSLQAYALAGRPKAVGGREQIYWDDVAAGIAFKFWFDREARKRYLESVIVYKPGSQLVPGHCISSSFEWEQLEPYVLETPSKPKRSADNRRLR